MPSSNAFAIERQESLAQDSFSRNGVKKQLHIVAKQIPFNLHVASSANLQDLAITAKLLYDFDQESEQKEVDTLKMAPIDIVTHVSKSGDKASVEVRLFVLSSQHEGAYFRVKLSAQNKQTTLLLETISHPIKVISKRSQARRMAERTKEIVKTPTSPSPQSSPSPSPTPVSPTPMPSQKRSAMEMIADTLSRLEEQQRSQAKVLQRLCSKRGQKDFCDVIQQPLDIPDSDDMDFESSFRAFLASFQQVSQEDRPHKLRKVLQTASHCDVEALAEVVDFYSVELGAGRSSTADLTCDSMNLSLDQLVSSPLSSIGTPTPSSPANEDGLDGYDYDCRMLNAELDQFFKYDEILGSSIVSEN